MNYPRSLVKDSASFDPIEVSRKTEEMAIDGDKRRYNLFRIEPFYKQMATARGVGCNLRCCFCWINPSRDNPEKYGEFYSPQEVYDKLIEVSSNQYGRAMLTERVRISGCEPTIGKKHLISLIDICNSNREFRGFLLETNGILLGHDESYAKELKKFKDYITVRLSLKAGNSNAFERKTGAKPKYFEFPLLALENLKRYQIPYHIAVMSQDPAIMPPEERRDLFRKLLEHEVDIFSVEEEHADPFGKTKERMVKRGIVRTPSDIRKEKYEPISETVKRAMESKGINALNSFDELKGIIERVEFKTFESSCASCTKKYPWHGYNVKDDLDEHLI